MKAYLIDELSAPDLERIRGFLKENTIASSLEQVYWVRIPDDLLTPTQFEHRDCQPHVFAVEVGRTWLKLEFFVRSMKRIRCSCPGYCSASQRNFVINFADGLVKKLGIRT